jgi:hypothetical protein
MNTFKVGDLVCLHGYGFQDRTEETVDFDKEAAIRKNTLLDDMVWMNSGANWCSDQLVTIVSHASDKQ